MFDAVWYKHSIIIIIIIIIMWTLEVRDRDNNTTTPPDNQTHFQSSYNSGYCGAPFVSTASRICCGIWSIQAFPIGIARAADDVLTNNNCYWNNV